MKQKSNGLSQKYVAALRTHLRQGLATSLQPALGLGRLAVALGLETLQLARIHEGALNTLELSNGTLEPSNGTLEPSNGKNGAVKRADNFFTEAITPIVETHRASRQKKMQLDRLNETLSRRTLELAATNVQLQRGVIRRKNVEAALKQSSSHYAKLLKDSLQLQESLRQLTHQVLATQESERRKLSHELQDEIAQTLLGINVRLLTLKQEARSNTSGLKNQIASTQNLVVKSARSVRRVARKFGRS